MPHLLVELLRSDRPRNVLVVDEGGYRQFRVHARQIYIPLLISVVLISTVVCVVVLFTPIREMLWGYDPDYMEQQAQLQALRIEALEDSLHMQQMYLEQLRRLITGEVESLPATDAEQPLALTSLQEPEPAPPPAPPVSTGPWKFLRVYASQEGVGSVSQALGEALGGRLRFPVVSPVPEGVLTRGYDPRIGHYAVDIATPVGTPVHSIDDGYVILADWTHDGGYVIAIQHADGYVSMYKHNRELTRQVGDFVRRGELIAFTGNTGEVSTGPHLHFELWHNGVPLNPEKYFFIP